MRRIKILPKNTKSEQKVYDWTLHYTKETSTLECYHMGIYK